jgi:hypothetical protein
MLKFFTFFVSFVFMFLLGVSSFNLFHIKEKLQMIQAVENFHSAQTNNDKKLIDNLLTEDFTESGVRLAVQTPDAIYKKDVVNYDYSKLNLAIEAKYLFPLTIFDNDNKSVSFIRKTSLLAESGVSSFSVYFYVTYTFETTDLDVKISKIERRL